jgi:hypothetical protein
MENTNDILPESDWILLSEQKGETDRLQKTVSDSLTTLQELEKLAGVTSREQYQEIKNDLTAWVRLQMLTDKKVRELSAIVPIEQMIVPDHLQKVQQLFKRSVSFDCLMYSNGWQVNKTALHEASNRLRSFAKSQQQIDRYKAAKSLADFLNDHVKIGVWNRHKFLSELVVWRPGSQSFEPVETFVLAPDDQYQN